MGACIVFGLLGLNSFRAPRVDCLTQEQEEILALFSLTPGYIDDCDSGSYPTLRLTGVNLQIVNGLGSNNALDGTGNLIVGYHNTHCGGGSHNVIIGESNDVSSYCGLVVGQSNTLAASYGVVFGFSNSVETTGPGSAVLGGTNNIIEGYSCTITGGADNFIEDDIAYNVIVGGVSNETTAGQYNVIGGGANRTVTGTDDWIAGSLFEDN
jgi:hypothetical protein